MEQRSLRLGDSVDDYCPRERRITNHAIVAIVEDAIRQTRCTTCDYEHGFKQGREPLRRKKPGESLYDQVLADVAGAQLVAPRADADDVAPPVIESAPALEPHDGDAQEPGAPEDTWPAHRSLIRATLPKTEGEAPPPRPIPEFTMHQKPQPARGRGAFRRLAFGPQGDPFGPSHDGRPGRGGQQTPGHPGGRNGNGIPAGNGQGNGNGGEPGQRRGRRRRGGQRSR